MIRAWTEVFYCDDDCQDYIGDFLGWDTVNNDYYLQYYVSLYYDFVEETYSVLWETGFENRRLGGYDYYSNVFCLLEMTEEDSYYLMEWYYFGGGFNDYV